MQAYVWAESCSENVIIIKELQISVTSLFSKWAGAPCPGEQTASSKAGGGENPNLSCTFSSQEQVSWFLAAAERCSLCRQRDGKVRCLGNSAGSAASNAGSWLSPGELGRRELFL